MRGAALFDPTAFVLYRTGLCALQVASSTCIPLPGGIGSRWRARPLRPAKPSDLGGDHLAAHETSVTRGEPTGGRQRSLASSSTSVALSFAPRLAVVLLLGFLSAGYVYLFARANPDFVSDFDQVWAGAAAIWRGENPYTVVGPRGAFLWRWPLYYPMPAMILAAPLGLLPVVAARMVFAGLSAALFSYAISRDGFQRWPVFISLAFLVNVELVQWSSLLAAAALIPGISWVAVAKPNLGVALLAAAPRSRVVLTMVGGSAILVAISFIVLPDWPGYWLANVRSATHFKPAILRPGGFLLALAALRWRRPEARLLLALACTPMTPTFYDPVLLFIIAQTTREALTLSASTIALYFVVAFVDPARTMEDWGAVVATASVFLLYLPCLVMVLRRKNVGELPTFSWRAERAPL